MSDLDARKSQALAKTGKAISIDGEEHLTQGLETNGAAKIPISPG